MSKHTPFRFTFFLLLLGCPVFLHSMQTTVEVRAAGFYHISKEYRDVYRDWSPSYEIEASFSCNCCYAWWANLSWFDQNGEGISNNCSSIIPSCCSLQPSTKISVANLSLGIKFPFCICEGVVGYVGIGPSFGNVWVRNHIPQEGTERKSKFAFGGVVKVGVDYYLTQCLFLDFFVDYLYQPVHFQNQIDIGGVKAGVGLGLSF